ncbi:MAG: NAD-binding protein, partial [Bacteroidales bacterium]|nr:NAD-binding protein [Bacteroidales bacterium]
MKVVIVGAAEVGTHLAKLLARENMDVTLIDSDAEKVGQLTFYNIMTLIGSPTSISDLKEAGVPNADLFVAVTPVESINIHACILAANLGARKTV